LDANSRVHVSDGFIREFKKRNGISSKRAQFKRHPAIDAEREARWREEIEELLGTVPVDTIYNADETSWRLYPSGVTAWAERGSDSITIASSGNEKECLTVMAAICDDGNGSHFIFSLVVRLLGLRRARSEMLCHIIAIVLTLVE
jgi:hypothetical protein